MKSNISEKVSNRYSRSSLVSEGSKYSRSSSRGSNNLSNSKPSLSILIPEDEEGAEANPDFTTPNHVEVEEVDDEFIPEFTN